MVKTTINLDPEIYKELVKEAVDKYGTTKTLSRIINEKLGSKIAKKVRRESIVDRTKGMWKTRESGPEYTRRIRGEWDTRSKRLWSGRNSL